MEILRDLLNIIPDGEVLQIQIGLNWTAAVIQINGIERCGLASTIWEGHSNSGAHQVEYAGKLEEFTGHEIAGLSLSNNLTLRSVGIAALNAMIPIQKRAYREANALELLAEYGKDKQVAMVGHFPFADRLQHLVGDLFVFELEPQEGDFPVSEAQKIIPESAVVAITGMTIINHTLEELLKLCHTDASVFLIGPSAPMSPVLFDYGVNVIAGARVEKIDQVLRVVMQGGNFHQVHQAGVKLVSLHSMTGNPAVL